MRYAIALNAKHPLGVRLNALGHVAVGLAHLAPAGGQRMRRFADNSELFVGFMSDDPLIVLSARNGQHLRQAHAEALQRHIVHNVFVIDMKDGDRRLSNCRFRPQRTPISTMSRSAAGARQTRCGN